MTRIQELQAKASASTKSARQIAEKAGAERRELTDSERSEYNQFMAKGRELLGQIREAKADASILDQARALASEIGDPAGTPAGGKSRTGGWAKATADRMGKALTSEIDGQKALVSGSIGVPSPIETDIVSMSEAPRRLLDLIPTKGIGGSFEAGNTFTFLKQTVRTNNAAPVADGAVKPTSLYTIEEEEDRVRVIAHLSEPVPERYFADHSNLQDFLSSEMEAGIYNALEAQVVSGSGTGENLTGLLQTSGIISQAFATDALTSIRKGMTSLEVYGIIPTALVLNPVDAEALDLLRDSGATGKYLLGDPAGSAAESLWRIPRVRSTAVAPGTAILGDWQQSKLIIREDATLAIDRSGENFTRNLVVMRLEGRFGFAVKRPNAFVQIALAAA